MISKFTKPSQFDFHPIKTIWKSQEDDKVGYWIQVSEDERSPKWITVGELLEISHLDDLDNTHFIDCTYTWYRKNQELSKE